ncbi:MAG: N-6 DNA methylase [Deltaproteobacteria bacterium]|nr:N-6 DNA methylase [Deltaproteobacteria bacterium]
MEPKLRAKIHDLVLKARELLMEEARSLLEGEYGLHADGGLEPAEGLPSLQTNAEAAETRRRLEQFLADEAKAGLRGRETVDKLVKEVAFTHLNRLVAFKMMEARKLIRGTIDRGTDSNAFKYYLVEHPEDEALWKRGEVDEAYRHFLLWQCGQIAREIKILFDPDNLPSRLFPRPRALKELLQMLNDPDVSPAWAEDETIGWVYQYFTEKEKAEVFYRLYRKKQRIKCEDIPAATELFTPRWIVKFLVQNTLGRTWLQMHPDSKLGEKLDYLVPLRGEIPKLPLKPVREITMLDPACGSIHFGLVAFDLFVEMYREEMAHAGQPGWPEKPSLELEEDIPAAIIANNLYGIDIDLRAVHLSALTLYLKAKTLNKKAEIKHSNLACADILLLDGERLEDFLKEMAFTRPVYGRVIRSLWSRLKDANQLGSLLRLEEEIHAFVEAEQEALKKDRAKTPLFPDRERFADAYASEEDFFELLGAQIVQAFDEFARREAADGKDASYFTGEAVKGLKLLDIMFRRYDCVVTNPPYMTSRNMNDILRDFLKSAYPKAKSDLYAAFIQRCSEWLDEGGRLGMITQQSFMFISSYEDFRKGLIEAYAIETMSHVGPRAFDDIGGEKVNGTAFLLRREVKQEARDESIGTYFRLVKEPDAEAKRNAFETALAALKAGRTDPRVYRYRSGRLRGYTRESMGILDYTWIEEFVQIIAQTGRDLAATSRTCNSG